CRAYGLGAVQAQVVVLDLVVVVLGAPRTDVIVAVDALEVGRESGLFSRRHTVDSHADDGSLVDLAEVEPERSALSERRSGPEQIFHLWNTGHQIRGIEAPFVLGRAIGIEVGRVDRVIARSRLADG